MMQSVGVPKSRSRAKSQTPSCMRRCLSLCRLSQEAEACRTAGNRAYFEKKWSLAIQQYSRGIHVTMPYSMPGTHIAPDAGSLHSFRAGAYLQRKWQGDAWAALQVL